MVCSPACTLWYILQQLHTRKISSCSGPPCLILKPHLERPCNWTHLQHDSRRSDMGACACQTQRRHMRVSGAVAVKPSTVHIWDERITQNTKKMGSPSKCKSSVSFLPSVSLPAEMLLKGWRLVLFVLSTSFPFSHHPSVLLCEAIWKVQKYFWNIFLRISSMQNNVFNAEITFHWEQFCILDAPKSVIYILHPTERKTITF